MQTRLTSSIQSGNIISFPLGRACCSVHYLAICVAWCLAPLQSTAIFAEMSCVQRQYFGVHVYMCALNKAFFYVLWERKKKKYLVFQRIIFLARKLVRSFNQLVCPCAVPGTSETKRYCIRANFKSTSKIEIQMKFKIHFSKNLQTKIKSKWK